MKFIKPVSLEEGRKKGSYRKTCSSLKFAEEKQVKEQNKRREHEGSWAFAKREPGTSVGEEGISGANLAPCGGLEVTIEAESCQM